VSAPKPLVEVSNDLRDSYSYHVVLGGTRHRKCRCRVPCQKRFRCQAAGHRGDRATPWCNGASDDMPEVCDACWCKLSPENK
jgi:hypothetical protein